MLWHQRLYYAVPTSHLCFRDMAECPWTRALQMSLRCGAERAYVRSLQCLRGAWRTLYFYTCSTQRFSCGDPCWQKQKHNHTLAQVVGADPPWNMYPSDTKGVQKTVISAAWGQKWGHRATGRTWRGWFMSMSPSWSQDFSRFSWQNSRFPFLSINKSLGASIKDIVCVLSILLPKQGPKSYNISTEASLEWD